MRVSYSLCGGLTLRDYYYDGIQLRRSNQIVWGSMWIYAAMFFFAKKMYLSTIEVV